MYFDIRINPPTTMAPNPPEWAGYQKYLLHEKNLAPFEGQPFSKFVEMLDTADVKRDMLIVGPNAKLDEQAKHIHDLVNQYPNRFISAPRRPRTSRPSSSTPSRASSCRATARPNPGAR